MAIIAGKLGYIVWDGGTGNSKINLTYGQSWTASITHDVAEITSMGYNAAGYWRTYFSGYQDVTASVECLLPTGGTDIVLGGDDGMCDDTCQLELFFKYDGTTPLYRALYGDAICTGVSISNDKDSIATVSYTFQGNGQWKWYSSGSAVPA
tara:strand:+ start:37 stop:489 length:453 start_codon:yes stop_codon:yes gene_type:complete